MLNIQTLARLQQHIFEYSPHAILVVSKDEIIELANEGACDFFAFAKAELIGLKLITLFSEKYVSLEGDKPIWIRKKDGSQALVKIKTQIIDPKDAAKKIIYITDTTESMIQKWALNGHRKDLLNTESDGKIGSWYWIFATDERYWSDEFYRICGLPPGDKRLNAETAMSFIHSEDQKRAISMVTKTIEEHIPYNIEKRIVRPNGDTRYVLARGNVDYNEQGKPFRLSGTMLDVTDLKTEQILALESTRKYQTLINNLNGIVYSCQNNLEYSTNYINEGCFKITGYTHEDFMKGSIHYGDIIMEEDRDYVWKKIQEALSLKKHFDLNYRIKCKNGNIKFVREIGCGVFDNIDSAPLLEGFITDVTEQISNQKELQENRDKNAALLYALPDMMFVQDNKGTFLEFHAPKKTKLLVPRNEIIGKNMKDILPPDVHTLITEAQKKILNKKELEVVTYSLNQNGQTAFYEARIVPMHENKILTIIRNITKEKEIEQELIKRKGQLKIYAQGLELEVQKRTEELVSTVEKLVTSNLNLEDQINETQKAEKIAFTNRFLSSAIAKNFPNGFIIVFNANYEIVLKEGAMIHDLRLDKVIYEGMRIDDIRIFSKQEKLALKEQVSQTIHGGHLSSEIKYDKKYFAVNTSPLLDNEGVVSSALFVYHNITVQKKIERASKAALLKEKELNELKSRFISMASHEFRTPLSAIQTSAILIAKQNEVGKEEKRIKYVNQIKNNVKNLVVILNDFLSLSKLEEGKVVAHREVFDLINYSKNIIKEISISKKIGQEIIFSSAVDNLSINLDPKLLRHILINLVSNAIKYSPENSKIIVQIKETEKTVSLSIQDEGMGIPEVEQKNVFERFFRAKNAQNIEGTGLGLNIVKQYVALMEGTVEFKSQANKGTTFLVKWSKPTTK